MLGQLSSDLVMEVLRSAPGSLQEQLPRLPQSLASLAALAHIPTLAAVCSPAPDCVDDGASVEQTVLTLCVCTSSMQLVATSTTEEVADEAADGVAGASVWPRKDAGTWQNRDRGLFTLESRAGVVACRLLARAHSLQGMTVCVPDCACLVLGPDALKLHGVTFQGACLSLWVAFCRC